MTRLGSLPMSELLSTADVEVGELVWRMKMPVLCGGFDLIGVRVFGMKVPKLMLVVTGVVAPRPKTDTCVLLTTYYMLKGFAPMALFSLGPGAVNMWVRSRLPASGRLSMKQPFERPSLLVMVLKRVLLDLQVLTLGVELTA